MQQGLLEYFLSPGPVPGVMQDPEAYRRQQLASAAIGFGSHMLAANQPGVSLGQSFGAGTAGAMNTMRQFDQGNLQNAIVGMKLAEMKRKADADLATRRAIYGPNHPMAGGTPWRNPDTGQMSYGGGVLERIPDPAQRSLYEAAFAADPKDAFKSLLAPKDTAKVTPAQKANNAEIVNARNRLYAVGDKVRPGESVRDALKRLTVRQSDTGRESPFFDPFIARDASIAMNRMVGEDSDYQKFLEFLDQKRPLPPKPEKSSAPPKSSGMDGVTEFFGKLFGGGSSSPEPTKKTEPSPFQQYPDAKRAPDGHWYVQKDGRWNRIVN